MSERIDASEFARREGCDEKQVRRGVERGALVRGTDGLIDAAQIGTAWRRPNRRTTMKASSRPAPTKAANFIRGDGETPPEPKDTAGRDIDALSDMLPLAEALRLKEHYAAMLRKLEYEQREGSLIELALAEEVVFNLMRELRDAWLAWPVKVASAIADELAVDIDHLTALLAEGVYQQLLELSEARADFTGE